MYSQHLMSRISLCFLVVLLGILVSHSIVQAQTVSCPLITTYLQLGTTHQDVITLKKYLQAEGLLSGTQNTTYFGTQTEAALKQWQLKKGIEPTGTVGPKTRAALLNCNTFAPPAASGTSNICPLITTTLARGSRHSEVRTLQNYFVSQNLLTSDSATGYFGALTERAVQTFQRANNLEPVGYTGVRTRAALRNCSTSSVIPPGQIAPPVGLAQPPAPPANGITEKQSCVINGSKVAHAASILAYQSSSVAVGETCKSEMRSCNDGVLTGTYQFLSCTPSNAAPLSCSFNGTTIESGKSVTTYKAASVSYGQACESENRICTNGVLSGSYTNTSCAVEKGKNCTLDGVEVVHGAEREFFSARTASSCATVRQMRTCTNGALSGEATYGYASCQNEFSFIGTPHSQQSFGDTEGNPANWPEPVFSDSPVPWSTVARNFDSVAFNGAFNSMGDTPFRWMAYSSINLLKGENGFGLYSYLGNKNDAVSLDAVTTMGALLGGSLAGIDYSAKAIPPNAHTVNIVRMIKKYFQSDTGANVFLSNVPDKGGWDWWYDILPNVFACQLADIYGSRADQSATGETSLKNLCAQAAARWYAAVDYLRDGNAVPEFAYQAVQLTSGVAQDGTTPAVPFQPMQSCGTKAWDPHIQRTPHSKAVCLGFPGFDGHVYESDASAGLAYLGLYDYLKNGTASGRQMAEWGLTFLDNITYNPFYEILLPYGAVASARMNATEGTNHNTKKILGYVFSESTLRPYWGMLGTSWSGAPVYGLMAARKQSYLQTPAAYQAPSYAFAMNTMGVAITLAPIPRYEEQFAVAIGKYLAHVSHNARYFYPQYAPYKDTETTNYIAGASESSVLSLSLPFEGIQSVYPGKVTNEPFATGDPVANNWGYKTNLGVYSGIYSGGMAAIMYPTNISNIYQIDTLATDFPKPNAYPTYLFYNPYTSTQTVEFDVGLARQRDSRLQGDVMLYDLVENRLLEKGSSATKISLTIKPGQALVVAAVPKSQGIEVYQGKIRTKGDQVTVDYHWVAAQ